MFRDQPTKGDIKEALKHLSKGLDGLNMTYEQAMERIEDQGKKTRILAKRILMWIVHATRPLSTTELQHALSVRLGSVRLDDDFLPSVRILRTLCAGLVTIDEQGDIVRLVHYTTQEYFQQTSTRWFADPQSEITSTCITYLGFDTFRSGWCQTHKEFEKRLHSYSLYKYAANNWGIHAIGVSAEINQLIVDFLLNKDNVAACSQAMKITYRSWQGYSQNTFRGMNGMHLAAYFNLACVVTGLLENGVGLDLQADNGYTSLSWATERGHEEVIKLLLDSKANTESKDVRGQTALILAAMSGNGAVVKLLLDNKADIRPKDDTFGRTALIWAAANDHQAVVRLLLEKKAGIESKDDRFGQTALIWAVKNGHEAVVKLLLENKADIESKDDTFGRTALICATENGHEAVVRLLLENKADIESKDDCFGQTSLSWASIKGHEAVVRLLLDSNADIESKDIDGQTALSLASGKGHKAVVQLLVSRTGT